MKHHNAAGCTPPFIVREEIISHGEAVRNAKTLDELASIVAPGGNIVYDIATGVDSEYPFH